VSQFDMSVSLRDSGERIEGGFVYATTLFERNTVERYLSYFTKLLEGMVAAGEGQAVHEIGILGEAERQQVLYEWNRTEAEIPSGCVHEWFEEQVRRRPEAVAVVHEGREFSYGELNRRANQLAHYLRGLGVKPDDRVAICVERSLEMIVGLLGVWKAGGAYVPLDPAYPVERLSYMLEDSMPVALLTQASVAERWVGMKQTTVPVLDLMEVAAWSDQAESNPERVVTGKDLAYMIYTSGSTGQPKGVMVEHDGLRNLAAAQIRAFAVEPDSRVLQFASFSFDACISEVVMALCRGALLYLLAQGKGEVLAGEFLIRTVNRNAITHATLPPALLAALPEEAELTTVRTLVVAGDTLSHSVARRWAQGRRLINAYGPTEGTVCATLHDCHAEEPGDPPIGRPIANTRIYVLDEHGEAVPVGVVGELYIGGAGVARGYWNRPELTEERFVQDRFADEAGARMYRTGDLGKWWGNGEIEFVGRRDFQVKIRGYRVEMEEIEARLGEHAGVNEAVVVVRKEEAGEKRLVAYYTSREGAGASSVAAEELRSYLAGRLPEYMVPSAYVRLETMPLTANGKLDRKALPAPERQAYGVRGYEAPEGEIETIVAEIWAEVLKVERVGRQDNFFELGGHSLLAMRMIGRLRQRLGVEIGVDVLFARPVLASLAEWIIDQQLAAFDSYDLANALKQMEES
jgi:amino acid adenylation domain-containing protein